METKFRRRKKIISKWGLIQLLLMVILLIGEISCIVKAIKCNWEPIGKAEIIYTVSAATGLGGIVGYINIEDN